MAFFPQTLSPGTVIGRLGPPTGPGPAEEIPFSAIVAGAPASSSSVIITTDVTFFTSADGLYLLSSGQLQLGGFTYGVNCNIACEYVPADFPNNVMISWNFPGQSNQFDFGIRTYPHLVVTVPGPFFPFNVPFKAISTFSNIEITFDYTVNGEMTNDVLIDMFLNNVPVLGGSAEIELFVRQPESLNLRDAGNPYTTILTAQPDHGRYDVYAINPTNPIFQVYPLFQNQATTYGTNPTFLGGVAGSPGTSPNNCSFAGGTPITGLTRTLAGPGTFTDVNGNVITYYDVTFSGTPGSSGSLDFSFETGLPSPAFQQWFTSFYLALVGGSLANLGSISLGVNGYGGNTSNQLEQFGNTAGGINAFLTSTPQQFCVQARMANLNTNLMVPHIFIPVTSGQAINFTLRIGGPLFVPEGVPKTTAAPSALSPPIYSRTITSGRIDILALLKALISYGFISGTYTFTALQMGPEIVSGQGSMYYRKFSGIVT